MLVVAARRGYDSNRGTAASQAQQETHLPIHPTAIVDPKAELDPTVEVGPYCIIDAHVRIAAHCRLIHNVYLTGWTEVGPGCELHPGAIVGQVPGDIKYKGARTYCRIGRDTILREYVTIHRGTEPESATTIGDRCFFLAGSHAGHNCAVADDVTIINSAVLGGHVQVGHRATLGGQAAVHQFVRVGELAMLAGTARVVMDVLTFALADPLGRISGLNSVGLRRAGIPREDILEIREAYRTLFASGLPFSEAVARVITTMRTPAGKRLAAFLAVPSRRGIAGRPKGHRSVFQTGDTE